MSAIVPMWQFFQTLGPDGRPKGAAGGSGNGVGVGPPTPLSPSEQYRRAIFRPLPGVDESDVEGFKRDLQRGVWPDVGDVVERLTFTPLEERRLDKALLKLPKAWQVAAEREAYRMRPNPPEGVTGYIQYWLQSDKRRESGPRKLYEGLKREKPEKRAARLPKEWTTGWSERGRQAIMKALASWDASPAGKVNRLIDDLIEQENAAAEKYKREHPIKHGLLGVPLTFSQTYLSSVAADSPEAGLGSPITSIAHLLGGADDNLYDTVWREELSRRDRAEKMAVAKQLGRGVVGPAFEQIRRDLVRRGGPATQAAEVLSQAGWSIPMDLSTWLGFGLPKGALPMVKAAPKSMRPALGAALNLSRKAGKVGFAGAGAKQSYEAFTDPNLTPAERWTGGLLGALMAAGPLSEELRSFVQTKPSSALYRRLEAAERSMSRQLAAGGRMGRQTGSTNLPHLTGIGAIKLAKGVLKFQEWLTSMKQERAATGVTDAELGQIWDDLQTKQPEEITNLAQMAMGGKRRNLDTIVADPPQAIRDLFQRLSKLDLSRENPSLAYHRVDTTQAQAIKQATGLDVEGYAHVLDAAALRHIIKRHGNEHRQGQLPVTEDDVAMLPDVVTAWDEVRYERKNKQGLDVIQFKKRINGHVFVVTEVRTGLMRLAPKTMFKFPSAPGGSAATRRVSGSGS
jgi:hypothetical protein